MYNTKPATTAMVGATTSRMKRIRWRSALRTPESDVVRGLAGCRLGASLRAGSAIVLLFSRTGGAALRDRLAQILFHHRKLGDDLFDALARHAVKRRGHHVLAKLAEPFEQRSRRGGEKQPLGAAIVGIGTALDQPVLAQPIEQPGQSDRLQIEHFSELRLLQPLETIKPNQHRPLRPGHAKLAAL